MDTTPHSDDLWEQSRRRLIPASMVGSLIEWYDISIYGQAAALVFGDIFFPNVSSTAGSLASFATFGVGYFARPVGAAIFGHVGDKHGRRVALVATLLLMGFATVLIGVLPTYGSVGLLAPALLVVLRLLQGAGVGAEYVGAVTMVAEFAPVRRRGYFSALPASGVFLGIGLAAAVSALVGLLPDDELQSWGWRIPFLLSAVVVGVGLVIRLRVPETPVFRELRETRERARLPLATMVRDVPGRLVLAMLANGPLAFNIYVVQTYALSYLKGRGVGSTTSLVALLIGCATGAVLIPLVGTLSDRHGRKPLYLVVSLFSAAIAFPFFALIDTGTPVLLFLAFALALGGGCLAMFGSQAAFFAEIFPARYRFSGFALSREVPGAALAGPAPAISVGLVSLAGGAPWLVASAMVLVGLVSAVAVVLLPETRGVPLDDVEAVATPAGTPAVPAVHLAGAAGAQPTTSSTWAPPPSRRT